MNWQQLRWEIPLLEKPEIIYADTGHHEPGVRRYVHQDLWTLHLYLYEGELTVLGHHLPICPGYASIIPPNTFYEYCMSVPAIHAVVQFKLPGGDGDKLSSIAAMQQVSEGEGEKFGALYRQTEEVIAFYRTQPRRAEVRLWDILWQLVDDIPVPTGSKSDWHPSVLKATHLIEQRLEKPILIGQLAREVGLSHDRLTKLFRATFNTTVANYILERRVSRACGLLVHTTASIKSIAAEVGFSDAQVLNKVMRRATGHSPRSVRNNLVDWAPSPIKRPRLP